MRITEKQEAILDQLVCQRLSADPKNKKLFRSFSCSKGTGLLTYLYERGWQEDEEGTTAFYVIKNKKNEILLFFSLKCGSLFDPLNEEEIEARIEYYNKLLEAIHADGTEDGREATLELLERIRSGLGMPLDQLESRLQVGVKHETKTLRAIGRDRAEEPNEKIIRVVETYPGIELVHFCANDNARVFWKRSGINRPMGEVLFWRYIAPIIYNIQDIIGCQYVYLFAADASPDRSLVNYYQVALNFEQPSDIGTSKPRYDFRCEFMCQKTNDLRKNRAYYFENFNPDTNDEVV